MSRQVACPNCRSPQSIQGPSGRLTCSECGEILPRTVQQAEPDEQEWTPEAEASALDAPAGGQPTSGPMTMLRNELRKDADEQQQQGGWVDKIFTRKGANNAAAGTATAPAAASRNANAGPNNGRTARAGNGQGPAQADGRVAAKAKGEPATAAQAIPTSGYGVIGRGLVGPGEVPIPGIVAGVLALILAALAVFQGAEAWARLVLLVTVVVLAIAPLAILHRRDSRKAFWQGFALFGWGYMVLAFVPIFGHGVEPKLPPGQFLNYLHAKAAPAPRPTVSVPVVKARLTPDGAQSESAQVVATPAPAGLFAVQASADQFLLVGQCLFALVAALLGAGVASWFQRTNPGAV